MVGARVRAPAEAENGLVQGRGGGGREDGPARVGAEVEGIELGEALGEADGIRDEDRDGGDGDQGGDAREAGASAVEQGEQREAA